MILRKPYAILIKNFKLIHAVLTFLMGYIIYKTFNVMSIFNDYFVSQKMLIGENVAATAYDSFLFIAPILVIILSLVLLVVMIIKKKPFTLYIAIIAIYLSSFVVLTMGKSTLLDMEVNILDVRLIKLVRDFTTMIFIAQIYPLIKSFVRTIGFDIKKFDFGKDLAELEVTEADNEEFEVSVNVNTNKMKRGLNFQKRNLRYVYKENKVLIWLAIILFVIITSTVIGLSILLNQIKYTNMNVKFNISGFNFKITNAYVTRRDYEGKILNNLNDQMSIVIIPFEVTNNNIQDKGFLTAHIELDIGEHIFRNKTLYRDSLFDLGYVYDNDIIKTKTTEYRTFMFEVPTNYLKDNMYLKIETSIDVKGKNIIPTYITIPIKAVDLDKFISTENINQNENIEIKSANVNKSIININAVEIAKRFKLEYSYKNGGDILPSYEYLYAPLNTNIDMNLMKIVNNVEIDEMINFSSLYDLIKAYGEIDYVIDNATKTLKTITKVNSSHSKKDELYVTVPAEIENAQSIDLVLNIRNYKYVYKIK